MIDDQADVAETPARGFFPELRVRLYNASRKPLHDETKVIVQWGEHDLSEVVVPSTGHEAVIRFRPDAFGRVVKVRAFPVKHRAVGKFVRLRERTELVAFHCPVKPEAVKAVNFDPFPSADRDDDGSFLLGTLPLHQNQLELDTERKVNIRNIWAKMYATGAGGFPRLTDGVKRILGVNRDRIWFEADPELLRDVEQSVDGERFRWAASTLHRLPDDLGPHGRLGSFKTTDRYGNLQLTFFGDMKRSIIEADIDDASGIGHLFQVLINSLPGVSTNPYDIGEILRFHQELDPGYELVV